MNGKVTFYLIVLCFLFYSGFSLSGSPGGLILYVHPMNTGMDFKNDVDRFFYAHYGVDSEKAPSCDVIYGRKVYQTQPGVDIFYIKKRIPEITEELINKTLENDNDRRRVRSILKHYRGENLVGGIDGVLFYQNIKKVIHFYGLSSFANKIEVVESTLPAGDIANEEKLGLALCKIFSRLPVPEA